MQNIHSSIVLRETKHWKSKRKTESERVKKRWQWTYEKRQQQNIKALYGAHSDTHTNASFTTPIEFLLKRKLRQRKTVYFPFFYKFNELACSVVYWQWSLTKLQEFYILRYVCNNANLFERMPKHRLKGFFLVCFFLFLPPSFILLLTLCRCSRLFFFVQLLLKI